MINSWSLAYDVLNGTLDEEYPIMTNNRITPQESDEYDPKPESTFVTSLESDEYDPIITVGSGNTASSSPPYFVDTTEWENISIDTSNCPVTLGLSTDQLFTTPPYV